MNFVAWGNLSQCSEIGENCPGVYFPPALCPRIVGGSNFVSLAGVAVRVRTPLGSMAAALGRQAWPCWLAGWLWLWLQLWESWLWLWWLWQGCLWLWVWLAGSGCLALAAWLWLALALALALAGWLALARWLVTEVLESECFWRKVATS